MFRQTFAMCGRPALAHSLSFEESCRALRRRLRPELLHRHFANLCLHRNRMTLLWLHDGYRGVPALFNGTGGISDDTSTLNRGAGHSLCLPAYSGATFAPSAIPTIGATTLVSVHCIYGYKQHAPVCPDPHQQDTSDLELCDAATKQNHFIGLAFFPTVTFAG